MEKWSWSKLALEAFNVTNHILALLWKSFSTTKWRRSSKVPRCNLLGFERSVSSESREEVGLFFCREGTTAVTRKSVSRGKGTGT